MPASSMDWPDRSEAGAASVNQRPWILAIAPGLQAASDERLASFRTSVATGAPDSTSTVTDAEAVAPDESTAENAIPCAPSCDASGVQRNSPAAESKAVPGGRESAASVAAGSAAETRNRISDP